MDTSTLEYVHAYMEQCKWSLHAELVEQLNKAHSLEAARAIIERYKEIYHAYKVLLAREFQSETDVIDYIYAYKFLEE